MVNNSYNPKDSFLGIVVISFQIGCGLINKVNSLC